MSMFAVLVCERSDMRQTKRKMVLMYSAEDFFSGKKDAKPVGLMSNPDDFGSVIVDRGTLFRLKAVKPLQKGEPVLRGK